MNYLTLNLNLLDDAPDLKDPDFSSWRSLFFFHLKEKILEKTTEKQKKEIEKKIYEAKQIKAHAAFKPKSKIFRPTRSLNELVKEYNKWKPRSSLIKNNHTQNQTAQYFNTEQKIDVISLPRIPGKILRPISR